MENQTITPYNLNETLRQMPEDFHLVLWAIIDTVLMVIIIGENILTICALRISRKLANLISNHFICSLAFSDLMVGLMLPYHLAFYITSDLGKCKYTCLLRFVMIVLACCASIYNLLAIALDRYIAIVHPLHYNRFMTKRVVFAIISAGWFCAITLASCPIYWNNWNLSETGECELYQILPKKYVVFVLTPSFASIWVAMLILYWRIWKEAREHTKRMKSASHHSATNNDWKSVQVVLLILGCFSICWLPYFIVILSIKLFDVSANPTYESAFTLAMANSGLNPAIYAWKNKGFRRAFLRLLKCKNPNLSENHFSYNYTSRKVSKAIEQPSIKSATHGICNGNEQDVLQSELNGIACKVKNNNEFCKSTLEAKDIPKLILPTVKPVHGIPNGNVPQNALKSDLKATDVTVKSNNDFCKPESEIKQNCDPKLNADIDNTHC